MKDNERIATMQNKNRALSDKKKFSVLNEEINNKVSLLSLIINENNHSVHGIFPFTYDVLEY